MRISKNISGTRLLWGVNGNLKKYICNTFFFGGGKTGDITKEIKEVVVHFLLFLS